MGAVAVRMVVGAALVLASFAATTATASPQSVSVPLHVFRPRPNLIKIGIELKLGGGPARMYELDTGSCGLYAAADAKTWPTFTPLPGGDVNQHYDSGVEYRSRRVKTTVAIPSDQGDVSAEVDVAQIVEAHGGSLGDWKREVEQGRAPLYGHFFGTMGSDLRTKNGLFAILPQLPGNLASGFIVQLGCDQNPRLVIGLTDEQRARFMMLSPMQPGTGSTFPNSGLSTYAQQLLKARFHIERRGRAQSFAAGALLDTGAPTTEIHESGELSIERDLIDRRERIIRPGAAFSVTAAPAGGARELDLRFETGRTTGRDRVHLARERSDDDSGYVNLGLIPFFRYDVMFDVARGVVGFAPCRAD